MAEPYNYTALQVQPALLQDFTQGVQLGAGLRQIQQARAQQAQQQALQQQYQSDLQSYFQQPTAQSASMLALKYPGQGEAFRKNWEAQDEAARKEQGSALSQVYAATLNGRPEIAKTILQQRIDAAKNSGADARAEQTLLALADSDPNKFAGSVGLILAQVNDPKTFAAQFGSLGKEQRDAAGAPVAQAKAVADAAKAQAEAVTAGAEAAVAPTVQQQGIRKTEAQISDIQSQTIDRAARLELDRDKLTTDVQFRVGELNQKFGELPESVAKNLNEAATQAIVSEQSASRILALATKFDNTVVPSGGVATVAEAWKRLVGSQDQVTALRQEYTRIRSQGVSAMLPPGPASDKDIQIAMSGFPSDKSNPTELSAFLRGMAKLQTYDATLNNAKAQWFGAVRNLGATKRDLSIDGVSVPAGTTFNDFARQYVAKASEASSATTFLDGLAAKYATPGAR